jgi:5-enolpyruvylshikimate-3-phosphate synthase
MIGPVESWPWRAHTCSVLDRFGGNLKLGSSGERSEAQVGALGA